MIKAHNIYDYLVIGSGIVGVSVAYHLKILYPKAKVLLLDKEKKPFMHQTSHNSGVVHSGVYYKKNSLKSKFCIEGARQTYDFAKKNNIKFNKCGKLIAARNSEELINLHRLISLNNDSNLNLELIAKKELKNLEPNLLAKEAIFSPMTGIIDWSEFSQCLLELYCLMEGEVRYNFNVQSIEENDSNVTIEDISNNKISGKKLISCSGLQSDRLCGFLDIDASVKIIPFRGDYYLLNKKHNSLFKHLIYPVPDNNVPFLGVHFTKMINGGVNVGPNACLSLGRESYVKWKINFRDFVEIFSFAGFWKLLFDKKKYIFNEILLSVSKYYYFKELSSYCDRFTIDDLLPYKSGIRAQAVDCKGNLVDDFLFKNSKRCFFVLNAPSPAATSSLPIGKYIVKKVSELI
jgi:(S)-2-hydroxyglutarate dehydrogenase